MRTLAQKFREEWTYHTNGIEGNTMTLQETSFFLREGLTAKGKTLREHFEVLNHGEAIDYLQDALRERDLSERLIKDFHAMLFEGVKSWSPGLNIVPGAYSKEIDVVTFNILKLDEAELTTYVKDLVVDILPTASGPLLSHIRKLITAYDLKIHGDVK